MGPEAREPPPPSCWVGALAMELWLAPANLLYKLQGLERSKQEQQEARGQE